MLLKISWYDNLDIKEEMFQYLLYNLTLYSALYKKKRQNKNQLNNYIIYKNTKNLVFATLGCHSNNLIL